MARDRSAAAPRILGLTGPIACGKSTVGDLLLDLGALERIDADQVVHTLMEPGTPTSRQIEAEFGSEILRPNGRVDRPRLAEVVFADTGALRALERIVHPAVRQAIRARLEDLEGREGVVVVDAVRLLQSDLLPLCDAVWVVQCVRESQVERLTAIRKMTLKAAEGRLAAQPSFEHPRVTRVIQNSGSMDELREQVQTAWKVALHDWGLTATQAQVDPREPDERPRPLP